ncbi:unnamed protein product [Effrenium voratum]|nr:unnamed protein product [Effrenium voratum]
MSRLAAALLSLPALEALKVTKVESGEWEPVLKIAQTTTLGFSSAYWSNDDLLNAASPLTEEVDAKYGGYLTMSFKQIKMCVGQPDTNCVTHTFEKEYQSAKELFTSGYIRDSTVDRDGILKIFGPTAGSYQDCPMQRPGFNIQCNDGNKARWGFCLNCASQGCQNDDSNDADAAIGIGLAGQSTPTEMGAGWTNYFASGAGTCSANSMTHKSVWVFVLSNVLASKPFTRTQHTWSTVMKIGKTTTLGFSSAYWENDQLLNENTDVTVEGDGKYSSYLSQAFKTIRMCVGSPDSGCVTHTFSKEYKSAKELFTSGYIRDTAVDRDGILKTFGPTADSYQNCPMQRPGFNIQCNDGNKARWGFCLNCASQGCQNDDSNDADAAIGIGLAGQSTPTEMGAGWTNYFASGAGTCSANSMTHKSVWVSVAVPGSEQVFAGSDLQMAGNYVTVVGSEKATFLSECSQKLSPAKCVEVLPGTKSFTLRVEATSQEALKNAVTDLQNRGVDLPSFKRASALPSKCVGTKAAANFGCNAVGLDVCDQTYTAAGAKLLQCGRSATNCLTTGPVCVEG